MPDSDAPESGEQTVPVIVNAYDVATDTFFERQGVEKPDGTIMFATGEVYTIARLEELGYDIKGVA